MKLVRETISFQRHRDPKEALFGTYKPGKVYAWYFKNDPEEPPVFMMFIEYDNEYKDYYPLKVYEFARGHQDNIVFIYPEENHLAVDSLTNLTQEQVTNMRWKLDHLDDEEQEFIRTINEETNLVPWV